MKNISITIIVLLTVILGGYYFLGQDEEGTGVNASVSVAEAMGGGNEEGYLRAEGPREFVFPEDHGPHIGFRTEWWYYTGNVFTEEGRQFGYQFTIFRSQLNPSGGVKEEGTDWSTDQLYLGHFAVSDVEAQNHVYAERYSRGAAGLAGAQADPFRIWLEDWSTERIITDQADDKNFPVRLKATSKEATIDLKVVPSKPLTLQGEEGYDAKGPEQGNASYYLSFTRMQTDGTITVGGESYTVSGSSWMDHEWSTSALGEEQEGWDWFSIQLSNGMDLMYYQLRNSDGSISTFTTGTLVGPDGEKTNIDPEDVDMEVLEYWDSPHSAGRYPSKWNINIPSVDLKLNLETLIPDQEMDVSVRYYEGTLSVSGSMDGESLGGQGFIEMTGYDVNE